MSSLLFYLLSDPSPLSLIFAAVLGIAFLAFGIVLASSIITERVLDVLRYLRPLRLIDGPDAPPGQRGDPDTCSDPIERKPPSTAKFGNAVNASVGGHPNDQASEQVVEAIIQLIELEEQGVEAQRARVHEATWIANASRKSREARQVAEFQLLRSKSRRLRELKTILDSFQDAKATRHPRLRGLRTLFDSLFWPESTMQPFRGEDLHILFRSAELCPTSLVALCRP